MVCVTRIGNVKSHRVHGDHLADCLLVQLLKPRCRARRKLRIASVQSSSAGLQGVLQVRTVL